MMASPRLASAIEKIGSKAYLDDLPDQLNDDAWDNFYQEFDLQALEYSALKKHRMAMVNQQQRQQQQGQQQLADGVPILLANHLQKQLAAPAAYWTFGKEVVQGNRILGNGLHGSVFSVESEGLTPRFVKTFKIAAICQREVQSLKLLNHHTPKITSVPQLLGVNSDGTAILATPVVSSLEDMRGKGVAWKLAAKLVSCLEGIHQAGLCHRDVQSRHMGYTMKDDEYNVFLLDWATSCELGTQPLYSRTFHYG